MRLTFKKPPQLWPKATGEHALGRLMGRKKSYEVAKRGRKEWNNEIVSARPGKKTLAREAISWILTS